MATVIRAKKDEQNESVIRRFKKQVLVDQILTELKKRDYYIKPSQVRKEKKKEIERLKRREKMLRGL
jgi:ribosomal protein S21